MERDEFVALYGEETFNDVVKKALDAHHKRRQSADARKREREAEAAAFERLIEAAKANPEGPEAALLKTYNVPVV